MLSDILTNKLHKQNKTSHFTYKTKNQKTIIAQWTSHLLCDNLKQGQQSLNDYASDTIWAMLTKTLKAYNYLNLFKNYLILSLLIND